MGNLIKILFFFSVFMISITTISQEEKSLEVSNEIKDMKYSYLGITSGIGQSIFRDRATSPLFYQGNPVLFGLSHLEMHHKRESSIQANYSFGNYANRSVGNNIQSNVKIVSITYQELFIISRLSGKKWNTKIGGTLLSSGNFRENNSFGNNSKGFEVVSNLCASLKTTLTFEFKKRPIKNKVSMGLNIGIINTAYRNEFIYTSQSPMLNEDNIYGGYELSVFSGFRVNSELSYIFWLKNNNALRMCYEWDLYGTGNKANGFEMASHYLNISILFNLK